MLPADFFPPAPDLADQGLGAPPWFSAAFGLVVVLVIAGVVFSIVTGIRKYRVLKDAGVDPLTVDAAVAAKVLNSGILAPADPAGRGAAGRSVEERLAEIDDLNARGVITAEERTAARADILRG